MTAEYQRRPYVARNVIPPAAGLDARFGILTPYVHGRPAISHAEPNIPSIDEFVDHLPPVEHFAPSVGADDRREGDWPAWGGEARSGAGATDAAAEAWAGTDWDDPPGRQLSRQSAAEALAHALDQIARRIRAGELRIPGPENVQDDAAIATTLATLLGIRR